MYVFIYNMWYITHNFTYHLLSITAQTKANQLTICKTSWNLKNVQWNKYEKEQQRYSIHATRPYIYILNMFGQVKMSTYM